MTFRVDRSELMLIDTHINIHGDDYAEDLGAVLDRAREAGVSPMIAICCRLNELDAVKAIAEAHADVYCTVGAHPHHAKDNPSVTPEALLELANHTKVVAIGETGLDLYYNHSDLGDQIMSLRAHIEAARRSGLPLVLHCRDADLEMADLLEEEMGKGAFTPLLHCYTGGAELARRAADLGAYFSASGIITFKKADEVRDVFSNVIPRDRVIIETDCPYLAPTPYRGKRNEPSYLGHVAKKLGELYGWSLEETALRTSTAARALFSRLPQ